SASLMFPPQAGQQATPGARDGNCAPYLRLGNVSMKRCGDSTRCGSVPDGRMATQVGSPALAARLRQSLRGEVLFDAFDRGRYSTDASIYQIEPIGVALPKGTEDIEAAIAVAREEGFPIIARGGGRAQNGQTLGAAVVMETSRYMNQALGGGEGGGTAVSQPAIVPDELNRRRKAGGCQFPVAVSPPANATIGGMTGNNAAGTRSTKYGITLHNVLEVEGVPADGSRLAFGEIPDDL